MEPKKGLRYPPMKTTRLLSALTGIAVGAGLAMTVGVGDSAAAPSHHAARHISHTVHAQWRPRTVTARQTPTAPVKAPATLTLAPNQAVYPGHIPCPPVPPPDNCYVQTWYFAIDEGYGTNDTLCSYFPSPNPAVVTCRNSDGSL